MHPYTTAHRLAHRGSDLLLVVLNSRTLEPVAALWRHMSWRLCEYKDPMTHNSAITGIRNMRSFAIYFRHNINGKVARTDLCQ